MLEVFRQFVLRYGVVGADYLLLGIALGGQAIRDYQLLKLVPLLQKEVELVILELGIVPEVGQVEPPLLWPTIIRARGGPELELTLIEATSRAGCAPRRGASELARIRTARTPEDSPFRAVR